MTRTLLVLRPEPACTVTAERARAAGWHVVAAPLFAIEPVAWSPPARLRHDALLLTSANAVRQAGTGLDGLRDLPVYAVGEATAAAAQASGLRVVAAGRHGVDAVLDLAALGGVKRLLHLAGEEHREGDHRGILVERRIVYRSHVAHRLPGAIAHAGRGSIALIHSPRSGRVFGRLIDETGLVRRTFGVVAISRAAADAAGTGWNRVEIAGRPADEALLAAARLLCEGDML